MILTPTVLKNRDIQSKWEDEWEGIEGEKIDQSTKEKTFIRICL